MKRVLVTRQLPQVALASLAEGADLVVRDRTDRLDASELDAALRDFDAVLPTLGDAFSAEVFARTPAPRCGLLANFGVGFNHIDAVAARAAGIEVTNTPGAVTDATADIAMALILMSARRTGEGERLVRSGNWSGWHPMQLLGLHVTGKTVGIIGMGRIGQAIARRAHFGFGMTIKFVNRSEKTVDFPARQVARLEDLAAQVDILVVATPGGAGTRHLINADVLNAMQSHALLINISRGDVVDEAALIAALGARQIGGAGLDVYEFEPAVPEALRALDNVVLLPHLGTSALEVRIDMAKMAAANVAAFLDGKPVLNPV